MSIHLKLILLIFNVKVETVKIVITFMDNHHSSIERDLKPFPIELSFLSKHYQRGWSVFKNVRAVFLDGCQLVDRQISAG